MKLTPMDVQQRRVIKRVYKNNAKYISAWRGRVHREYRVVFGIHNSTTGVFTKNWFTTKSHVYIYNIKRGKRRFIKRA